jgi:hypothetical protein
MCPEITDDELKQFTALKEASAKADADAKAKTDADAAKAKADADAKAKLEQEGNGGLRDKAAKEREDAEARKTETKRLEGALRFNMGLSDFVKTNADIIPAEMTEILKVSEKEKYDSAIEKASALKKAFVESFFAVQSNVDLLTSSQKAALDDWGKLTKNGKEAKAETIFENLFEPALETLKKVKKAEELGKAQSGFANSSKTEDGYKARLMASSKKTYLGEKGAT